MSKKSFISCCLVIGIVFTNNFAYADNQIETTSEENNKAKLQQIVTNYNAKFVAVSGEKLIGYNKQTKEDEKITISKIIDRLSTDGHLPVDKEYLNYTSRFGRRGNVFSEESSLQNLTIHTGLDIAAANIENSNAYNVLDGKVEKIEISDSGYGNLVIVDHGDFRTYYAHLNSISNIREGDKLKGGEIVGKVGNTGRSTGPHLHFEINIGYTALNPEVFMPYIVKTSKIIADSGERFEKTEQLQKATRNSSLLKKREEQIKKEDKIEIKSQPKKAYELTLDPPETIKKKSSNAVPFDFSGPEVYSFKFDFQQ